MELKEGMYVRTKDGVVFILDKIEDNHLMPRYVYIPYIIIEKDVIKASYDIIDLIEVGDYVNGFRVDEIGEYHSIKTDKTETYIKVNCSSLLNCFYEEDIKSIVTKEQFESMSYKVGE